MTTGLERSVFIPIPQKGNAKECSNYLTIALISHASKVMLKSLQARLQQYVNCELPDVQAGFRKGRGTRDQIANIRWIMECREPVRHSTRDKGHRKEARHTQRRDRASGVPLDILKHLPPKNQSLPTLLLCAFTSDFTGGCPPRPSHSLCQRVNLQLQLIKFLGIRGV